jgi:acyl-CoA thioester hydrolase
MHESHVRVTYSDTDAGGVVHHAAYLRYFDQARSDWLDGYGIGQRELKRQTDIALVVRSVQVDYLNPAHLDDRLSVRTEISNMTGAAISLRHDVVRADLLIVSAQIKLVSVDTRRLVVVPLPPALRAVRQ